MLSVASLLNPDKSVSLPRGTPLPSSPTISVYTTSSARDSPHLSESSFKKQKMSKDGPVFIKGKVVGDLNYAPFDQLDADTLREVQRYQIHPLGTIQEYPRTIPYNSEKKSFWEKTGRETFEVFQYTFRLPGEEKPYTVMWDYNIGLVRITPFFKCCNYSKTMPAKMLNMNPGLKEITHSITGGALAAQGYWMPYTCAYSVCQTFCTRIAPALIPLFGPTFPSHCTPVSVPKHGLMTIDASTIQAATAEAEHYRVKYGKMSYTFTPLSSSHNNFSPSISNNRTVDSHLNTRLHMKRTLDEYGMGTPTEIDMDTVVGSVPPSEGRLTPLSFVGSPHFYPQQSGWRAANVVSHDSNSGATVTPQRKLVEGTDPWLSSIPRSTAREVRGIPALSWSIAKPPTHAVDAAYEDDDAKSNAPKTIGGTPITPAQERIYSNLTEDDKNAALTLMQLSMDDMGPAYRHRKLDGYRLRMGMGTGVENDSVVGTQGPMLKRRKGASI